MTGQLFEWEVVGRRKFAFDGHYLKWREALNWVIRNQSMIDNDPLEPNTLMLSDLQFTVADTIGVDANEIRIYSALGSAFDFFHGVDIFIAYEGKIVTIDLTVNESKRASGYKADIILSERDFEKEDIWGAAQRVASVLLA